MKMKLNISNIIRKNIFRIFIKKIYKYIAIYITYLFYYSNLSTFQTYKNIILKVADYKIY
jgi:hypothetical protein